MATLVRFDAAGTAQEVVRGAPAVSEALAALGLGFGRWPELRGSDPRIAYADEIAALIARYGIRSQDRVALKPDDARWPALRAQFQTEHTHDDFEIRVFVGGRGLFHVRGADAFYGLLCEAGDWVSVPAGTQHNFDAGAKPDFDALRFFVRPDGWVAQPTEAARPALPDFDAFIARFA